MTFEEWYATEYPEAFHMGGLRRVGTEYVEGIMRGGGDYEVDETREFLKAYRAGRIHQREQDAGIAKFEHMWGTNGIGIADSIINMPIEEE